MCSKSIGSMKLLLFGKYVICICVLTILRHLLVCIKSITCQELWWFSENWITQTLIDVLVYNDLLYICARKDDGSGAAPISIYSLNLRNGSRNIIGNYDSSIINAYFQMPY